jgi:short-subunit dehydrogenase
MTGMSRSTALVAGASSGIGEAFARRLAADGHDLVLVARRGDRLRSIADELEARHGTSSEVVAADLAAPEGLEGVVSVIRKQEALDVVVYSAGFGTRGLFAEIDPLVTEGMIGLHVTAPAKITRAALPGMVARGRGRIMIVSSLSAFFTTRRYVTYSATKSWINMFCTGLSEEVKGSGVRVQALCPGLTRTGFFDSPDYRDFKYDRVPSLFWMSPEEVADQCLASRDVVFIPGLHNRLFVRVMKTPVVGDLAGWMMGRLGRGGDGLY